MRGYAIRQMRKEYRGVLRAWIGGAVILLMMTALFGAFLYKAQDVEMRLKLVFTGMLLLIVLLCFAGYLITSDEKWLLRHTPFGQALNRHGDPAEVMKAIDQSAQELYDSHGRFTLLKDWLILEYPCWWRWEPYRSCALPIPRSSIEGIRLLPEKNPDDPQEMCIQIVSGGETHVIYVYQQQDVTALRVWMGERIQHDE